jgi:hypothetical protein
VTADKAAQQLLLERQVRGGGCVCGGGGAGWQQVHGCVRFCCLLCHARSVEAWRG